MESLNIFNSDQSLSLRLNPNTTNFIFCLILFSSAINFTKFFLRGKLRYKVSPVSHAKRMEEKKEGGVAQGKVKSLVGTFHRCRRTRHKRVLQPWMRQRRKAEYKQPEEACKEGRQEGRKEGKIRVVHDTSELAACNFSHQRAASFELVMPSLKHVTPDAAYWLAPDPHHQKPYFFDQTHLSQKKPRLLFIQLFSLRLRSNLTSLLLELGIVSQSVAFLRDSFLLLFTLLRCGLEVFGKSPSP